MASLTRRQALQAVAALAGCGLAGWRTPRPGARAPRRVPLLHLTDLYHPPQDPDDQIDLATVLALDAFDLRGVVLDVTQRFLDPAPAGFDVPRDPGFVPAVQLAYLTGRSFPVAAGPAQPLRGPDDDARDRPRREQAGVELVLDVLARSREPVVVSVTGSARVLTAAFNRDPERVRARVRAVLLNAGSTGGPKPEWNVMLDPAAFVGLWRSGVRLHWYPCATERGAFVADHERGTYWNAAHEELFHDLPEPLAAWFAHGFTGNLRGDVVRALDEQGRGAVWEHVLAARRNLWSTASLVTAAGRVLARTGAGWRFVREETVEDEEVWPWRLDPIAADVDDAGRVSWRLTDAETPHRLFGRRPGADYASAMTEALNALLRALPV